MVILILIIMSGISFAKSGVVMTETCCISYNVNDIIRLLHFNGKNERKAAIFTLLKLKSGEFKVLKLWSKVNFYQTRFENVLKIKVNDEIYYTGSYNIYSKK